MEYKFLLAFHIGKDYRYEDRECENSISMLSYSNILALPTLIAEVIGFRILNLPSGKIEDISIQYFIEHKYHINGIDTYSKLSDAMRIGDKLIIEAIYGGRCNLYLNRAFNNTKHRIAHYDNRVPYLLDNKIFIDKYSWSATKSHIVKLDNLGDDTISVVCDFMSGGVKFEYAGVSLLGNKSKCGYHIKSKWECTDIVKLLPVSLYTMAYRLINICNKSCIIESRRDNNSALMILCGIDTLFIGEKYEFDWGNIRSLVLPPTVKRVVLVSSEFSKADGDVRISVSSNAPLLALKNLVKSFSTQYKKIVGVYNCKSIGELNEVLNKQGIYIDTY